MSVYLHDIPLEDANAIIQKTLVEIGMGGLLGSVTIPLNEDAIGRITAEPIWARLSSPHYHASAMDGFAVRSVETNEAAPGHPIDLSIPQQASYLDTGDPLPMWADAVIPIEDTEPLDLNQKNTREIRTPASIRIRQSVHPWKNIRPMGEDMVATQLVLPAWQMIRPVDLGAVAGSGHDKISVARKPRVAVIPTGSELRPIGETVAAGEIIEYNSLVLAAQIREWGGAATRYPIVEDKIEIIQQVLKEAARDHDLILINAGSSAGADDYSATAIAALGRVLFHGVAVRPGHPVIFGTIRKEYRREVPIFGVPGYPVSAFLTGEIFIEPVIRQWLGYPPHEPTIIQAEMTRKLASPGGDDDYVRVIVGKVGERTLAAPLTRGAGVISSLVRADGIVKVPKGSQGVVAGAPVLVRLYRSPAEIERTILAIGSHDMTLDLLAQHLSAHQRRFSSANVGSLGGLVALRRGEAHLAGSHLLDPETGVYNELYIRQYLPDTAVIQLGFVFREQGLMVAPGNPLKIRGLEDLARTSVRFSNRQRGAGTRVLLDYHLEKLGIAPVQVQGYEQEEYTHLAVAASVASGRADCGLGIPAAALPLGLEFFPLFHEQYDFIIPVEFYRGELLKPLLEVIRSDAFQQSVLALPGYTTSMMGQVIKEIHP